MNKPLSFDKTTIESNVHQNKPGNYHLGKPGNTGDITPKYTGRSDACLRTELLARLNSHKHLSHFSFSYASNAVSAYEVECQKYHKFIKQLENEIHPAKPEGTTVSCPEPDCDN